MLGSAQKKEKAKEKETKAKAKEGDTKGLASIVEKWDIRQPNVVRLLKWERWKKGKRENNVWLNWVGYGCWERWKQGGTKQKTVSNPWVKKKVCAGLVVKMGMGRNFLKSSSVKKGT